jgi:hypothetical protein
VLAFALTLLAVGIIFGPQTGWLIAPVGVVAMFLGILGWLAQPAG